MNKPTPHSRKLGELMCTMTRQLLWPVVSARAPSGKSGTSLLCRVGSGQATYHRFIPERRQHQITYGARMIEAKQQPDTASGWLSAREISQRGYFGGQLSTLNLLTHTCCHEFAHLLQHNAGQRHRGSVHNRHFYRILDDLHTSGQAEAGRRALLELADERGVILSSKCFEFPDPIRERTAWKVGDAVSFSTSTRDLQGEIRRVNRKTCTVHGTGSCRGVRYRVPVQLLRKVT